MYDSEINVYIGWILGGGIDVSPGNGEETGNVRTVAEILPWLISLNERPKPFVCTADADLVLGKMQRLCERISNSPKTSNARISSTNV